MQLNIENHGWCDVFEPPRIFDDDANLFHAVVSIQDKLNVVFAWHDKDDDLLDVIEEKVWVDINDQAVAAYIRKIGLCWNGPNDADEPPDHSLTS